MVWGKGYPDASKTTTKMEEITGGRRAYGFRKLQWGFVGFRRLPPGRPGGGFA